MRRSANRKAGFSLIEMIAALTIFSIAGISVIHIFAACLGSTAASVGHTHAALLAQEVVEQTLATRADGLEVGVDNGSGAPEHANYTWERKLEETDQVGLLQLTVTVSWRELGRDKNYVLTTLIAEQGAWSNGDTTPTVSR